jgi:CRP/FNR family transcriptional regulator
MTAAQMSVATATRHSRPAAVVRAAAPTVRHIRDAVPRSNVIAAPGAADALQRIGHQMQVPRGRTVIEAGSANDAIIQVRDGILRVVHILPDGRRHVACFLKAGDFYGLSETEENESSVEAITACTLTRYPRRDFDAVLDSDAAAGRQLLRLVCRQLAASDRMLLLLGRKTAAERLASFLLSFASRAPDGSTSVFLPMSRADIADYLGLTIETVSRLVTRFRTARWIRLLDAHTISITNLQALETLSEN